MLVRNLSDVERDGYCIDWGCGTSHRLLTEKDGMGYTVCHTVVRAGTESLLQYRNHLEACYCIAGEGEVEDMDGNVHRISPGTIYVLDKHDRHFLRADEGANLVLVSVFNPPLKGHERHRLDAEVASSY